MSSARRRYRLLLWREAELRQEDHLVFVHIPARNLAAADLDPIDGVPNDFLACRWDCPVRTVEGPRMRAAHEKTDRDRIALLDGLANLVTQIGKRREPHLQHPTKRFDALHAQAAGHRELAVGREQLAELVQLPRLHRGPSAVDDRAIVSHGASPLQRATRSSGRRIGGIVTSTSAVAVPADLRSFAEIDELQQS